MNRRITVTSFVILFLISTNLSAMGLGGSYDPSRERASVYVGSSYLGQKSRRPYRTIEEQRKRYKKKILREREEWDKEWGRLYKRTGQVMVGSLVGLYGLCFVISRRLPTATQISRILPTCINSKSSAILTPSVRQKEYPISLQTSLLSTDQRKYCENKLIELRKQHQETRKKANESSGFALGASGFLLATPVCLGSLARAMYESNHEILMVIAASGFAGSLCGLAFLPDIAGAHLSRSYEREIQNLETEIEKIETELTQTTPYIYPLADNTPDRVSLAEDDAGIVR